MVDQRWVIEDAFGMRWDLRIAWGHGVNGLPRDYARFAIRELVGWCFHDLSRADEARAMLLEIHDELTGGALSSADWYRADLDALLRASESISEALEWEVRCGRLRIQRAPEPHVELDVDEAPDTVRNVETAPPPASAPEVATDWIAVVVRDDQGVPLANVRCRVTAPGRSPLVVATDSNGRVLLREIETGACVIELPDIDGREWNAGAGAG